MQVAAVAALDVVRPDQAVRRAVLPVVPRPRKARLADLVDLAVEAVDADVPR